MRTAKEESVKGKDVKIKEEGQQRKHWTNSNAEQTLLQTRPCPLEGQCHPEKLPAGHSSAWLLLPRPGKRCCRLQPEERPSDKCWVISDVTLLVPTELVPRLWLMLMAGKDLAGTLEKAHKARASFLGLTGP